MGLVIYGDFNCPYSYLASQRMDLLARAGVGAQWRAVEHDRRLPLTGAPSDAARAAWERELAEVASLALPGEIVPAGPPPLVSNTGAAVSAYAEALADSAADALRRRLFQAIWVDGAHLSSAYAVRRLVAELMWRTADVAERLASPEFPSSLNREPDLARVVRGSGCTIAPDGGPLTTTAWRLIADWRHGWQALPSPVIPAVVEATGAVHSGVDALRRLAELAPQPDGTPVPPGAPPLSPQPRRAPVTG